MQDQKLESIDFWHVPAGLQAPVRDWYAGRLAALAVDGSRSVRLPHPGGTGMLKLKGAGFEGGPVRFGEFHNTGPKAPVFDFEGRMMEDVAAGHDGAFRGGASFQQAATEYHISARLAAAGLAVVPCLGYGRIAKAGRTSWFSLMHYEPGLHADTVYPEISRDRWVQLNHDIGALLFMLAVHHDLIGYCWYALAVDGRSLIRDVHPFRIADPINMSQLSWVMQLFYAMHIRSNSHSLRAPTWNDPLMPPDLHVWPFRAACPDATVKDHEELRRDLVIPYMLGPPKAFSVDALIGVLRGNRITAALMQACPIKFARV
jgi:hypothetical protein